MKFFICLIVILVISLRSISHGFSITKNINNEHSTFMLTEIHEKELIGLYEDFSSSYFNHIHNGSLNEDIERENIDIVKQKVRAMFSAVISIL